MNDTVHVLNRASIRRRFDAYVDVDWDDPDLALDLDDPRLELPDDDPLGATAWYRAQPAAVRSRLGLHVVCEQLHVGMDFEGVLSAGLLELSRTLPVDDPRRRYALHEVIEEAQHTLMFRELIARSGLETRGLRGLDRLHSHTVPAKARRFPEYFFLFVLGGEAPVDRAQRDALRPGRALHPLLRTIIRIHVTEEARHISFAEAFLRERVPRLSRWRRAFLSVRAPIIFGEMSKQMLTPPRWLTKRYGVPKEVLAEAYGGPRQTARLIAGAAKVRRLVEELGLIGPLTERMWRFWRIAPRPSHLLPATT